MKLSSSWTKGIKSTADRKELEAKLIAAEPAFKILDEILKEKYSKVILDMRSKDNYKLPAWSELQADSLGYLRAVEEISSLIAMIGESNA